MTVELSAAAETEVWTGTTALELWAPVLRFNAAWRHRAPWWPQIRYRVPRNSCDPRWAACVHHHPACDCREAELNEQLNEYRHEAYGRSDLVQRMRAIARLHRPQAVDNSGRTYCPTCGEQGPCSTRVLAVEALKAAHDWYPGDEDS